MVVVVVVVAAFVVAGIQNVALNALLVSECLRSRVVCFCIDDVTLVWHRRTSSATAELNR